MGEDDLWYRCGTGSNLYPCRGIADQKISQTFKNGRHYQGGVII